MKGGRTMTARKPNVVAILAVVLASAGMAYVESAGANDYYIANQPGSGAGAKDDPFGLADLPKPDNKPTTPLTVLQPADTLYFKGGEYALHTGPVKNFYYVGYLCPVRSGEPGKPISFRACPDERVVLTAAGGGQPRFGRNAARRPNTASWPATPKRPAWTRAPTCRPPPKRATTSPNFSAAIPSSANSATCSSSPSPAWRKRVRSAWRSRFSGAFGKSGTGSGRFLSGASLPVCETKSLTFRSSVP